MANDDSGANSKETASRGVNPYQPSNVEINPPRDALPVYVSVPLAIALIAIVTVAFVFNIGLGISLLVLAVPAYIRAVASSFRKVSAGQDVTNIDRILTFFGSLGVVFLSCIAGGVGFFVTCCALLFGTNGGQQNEVLIFCILGGGFFVTAGIVYWLFWPKRRR